MKIRLAKTKELNYINQHDYLNNDKNIIKEDKIFVILDDNLCGFLRYGLFWDHIPFVNMLYIDSEKRGCGYGRMLLNFFEEEMIKKGYKEVMTSTVSKEEAKSFYLKCGYQIIGGFVPLNEEYELLLRKELK